MKCIHYPRASLLTLCHFRLLMASSSSRNCAFEDLSTCLSKIRVPGLDDNVHKEECCLSFESQESVGGLYVCLTTFLAFSSKYVELFYEATRNRVFLHLRRVKKEVLPDSKQQPTEKKPKRLAIGVEDGFNPDQDEKVEFDLLKKLVLLPEFEEISLEEIDKIPSLVLASVSGVLSSTSALMKEEILAWDGEERPVTKHGHSLTQLDNGVKIPPSGWKCAQCELTSNLWLNLTDGTVLCGRRFFDGTGGNNHAVAHYKNTGFPLAVKLGTITPNGADVHSYDEDTMVQDPNLPEHLSHFGINMMNMEKTEQTMTEMEIELNEKLGSEWNIIQEAGSALKELHGPGLVGIKNMGNSCYLNSTLQVLFSLPEFQQRFSSKEQCLDIFRKGLAPLKWELGTLSSPLSKYADNPNHTNRMVGAEVRNRVADFASDFNIQMCKVGLALNSPSSETENCPFPPITPRSFKQIVGKGHQEFSTNRQQDAHEFLLHLLSAIERSDRKEGIAPAGDCFKFLIEERVECLQSKQVRYLKRCEYILSLPVPIALATNKDAVEEYAALKQAREQDSSIEVPDVVRADISFQSCINSFAEDEMLTDFWSSALKEKSEAKKRSRFATFPECLVIQLKKFTVGSDWVPKKLDVSISMPDTIDLNQLRSTGLQKDEVLLPDISPPTEKPPVPDELDENAVLAISQMGFPLDRCRAAVVATGNTGAEPAIMWLMENPDAEVPSVGSSNPPEACVTSLMDMGFTREQALKALKATNNVLERAADWIFSHLDELEVSDSDPPNPSVAGEGDVVMDSTVSSGVTDGPAMYELFGFISHMGTSTMCGHYVCHVKKQGRWVIYNDEKVAESVQPPKELGYIYFYRRVPEC